MCNFREKMLVNVQNAHDNDEYMVELLTFFGEMQVGKKPYT